MNSLIDQIYANLRKVDEKELVEFYRQLYPGEGRAGIYTLGDGRTLKSLKIGTAPLSSRVKDVTITGSDENYSFGENIVEVFSNLNQVCGKSNLVLGSGSGGSAIPYKHAGRLKEAIENGSVKADMCLITSFPDSPIGNLVKERNGAILKLAGRTSKTTSNDPYLEEGILEDLFELGGLKALRTVSSGIIENVPPEEFFGYYRKKIDGIKETKRNILELKKTPEYLDLVDALFDPVLSCFSCGESVKRTVVEMANIRTAQVRPLTVKKLGIEPTNAINMGANRNYVIGESGTPNVDKNSVFIGVSESGTSPRTEHYLKDAKSNGAKTFALTGKPESTIADIADNVLLLNGGDANTDYCIAFSEILTDLGHRFVEKGIEVNENIFRGIHVRDKIAK